MEGPRILVASLSTAGVTDRLGNHWQYHPRSDRHSKIACWGILFDLLGQCRLLRDHIGGGKLVFGINHEMTDFKMHRRKNLDLVLCRPAGTSLKRTRTFRDLASEYGITLDADQHAALDAIPGLVEGPVGAVEMALEAKACMTEHVKALPRLYDELNSSHLTIHGATDQAIAVGFVMVNLAQTFVSPDRHRFRIGPDQPVKVSPHKQPVATERTIEKIRQLPRRTRTGEEGFDAIGIVTVECQNDGTPVRLVSEAPAVPPRDPFHYDAMIRRTAQTYESRFPQI